MRIQLAKIEIFFPNYTDHGYHHSSQLEKFLDKSIPPEIKENFEIIELFVLLASLFLHDVGMIGEVKDQNDEKKLELLRQNHHLNSEQFVLDNYKKFKISKFEAELIGILCKSHRSQESFDINQIDEILTFEFSRVRLRFLCCCLRFADECHITFDRIEGLIAAVEELSDPQKEHFIRHARTIGVAPSEFGEIIEVTCDVDTNEEIVLFKEMEDKMQRELNAIHPILKNEGINWYLISVKTKPSFKLKLENSETQSKILWNLANNESLSLEEFRNPSNLSENDLKIVLNDLIEEGIIAYDKGKYSLILKIESIYKVYDEIVVKEKKYDILQSNFFQNFYDKLMLDFVKQRFKQYLKEKELITVLELVKYSPTALNYVLYGDISYFNNSYEEFEKVKEKLDEKQIKDFKKPINDRFVSKIITAFNYDFDRLETQWFVNSKISGLSRRAWLKIYYEDEVEREYFSDSEIAFRKLAKGSSVKAGQFLIPANLESEISEGLDYIKRGYYDKAIAWYSRMLSEGKATKEVWVNLGLAHIRKKEYKKSIFCADNALKIDPEIIQAWSNRGLAVLELKYFIESIKNFNRALKINPDLPKTLYYKGLALYELNQRDKAIEAFERAKKLGFTNKSDLWFQLSLSNLKKHDFEQALLDINKAIELDEHKFNYHYIQADILMKLNQFQESLNVLLQIVHVIEKKFYDLKEKNEAFLEYREEIPKIYNKIAWNSFKLGYYSEGEKYSKKAVKLKPENNFFRDTLACNQFYLGKIRNSRRNFDIILKSLRKRDDLEALTINVAKKLYQTINESQKFNDLIAKLNQ